MRDSFVFYESFFVALQDLKDKDRLKIYDAICKLALYETDTNLNGISKTIFTLIKPQIVANARRYENGKKGGRPKKETIGYENKKTDGYKKTKTSGYEIEETKTEPNVNVNDNVNVNENDNVNDNDNVNGLGFNQQQTLFELIETGFGRTLNGIEYEEIATWEDNELTRYAIKKSILNGKCSISYIQTVLGSYKIKNISTVQQAQQEEKEFKESKNKATEYKTIQQRNMEFLEQRKKQREAENVTS